MAKSPELQFLFLRSGPTDWDEGGRLQGRTDLPLSASAQASLDDLSREALGALGAGGELRVVLAAPDEASTRIAEAIAAEAGVKVRTIEDLAGLQCGLWEGRLETDLADRSPKAFRQWRQDPSTVSPPEGETAAEAQSRVLGALNRALDKVSHGAVAVVARPMPLGIIRGVLDGRPLTDLWETIDETPRVWTVRAPRSAFRGMNHKLDASA